MQSIETKQISFDRGIIESMKQNSFVEEQGNFASALYIENFNPNLEHKSLVKRPGIVSYEPTHKLLEALQQANYFEHRLSKVFDFKNHPDQIAENGIYKYAISHVEMMNTSRPAYNETYIVFFNMFDIDHKPMTGVLGHVVEYDRYGNLLAPRWIWPGYGTDVHKDYSLTNLGNQIATAPLSHRGWIPYGTYEDSKRAAGYIVFCTTANETDNISADLLFPCYKWGLWDITKKREKDPKVYWNGLDSTILQMDNKDDQLRWKVLRPTQELRQNKVKLVRRVWDGTAYGPHTDPTTGLVDDTTPIQLIIDETFFKTVRKLNNAGAAVEEAGRVLMYNRANDYADAPNFRFKDKLVKSGSTDILYISANNWFFTYEVPDIEQVKQKALATWPTSRNPALASGKIVKYTDRKKPSNYQEITDTIECLIADHWYTSPPEYTQINSRTYKDIITVFEMLNYKEANTPRPFMKGEEIPIIVTFIINGAEVIALQEIYTVYSEIAYHDFPSNVGVHERKDNVLVGDYSIDIIPYITEPANGAYGTDLGFTGVQSGDVKYPNSFRAYPGRSSYPHVYDAKQIEGRHGNIIKFGLRIHKDELDYLIDTGLQAINIYVSKPDTANKVLKYAGVQTPTLLPNNVYSKPRAVEFNDYTNYMDFAKVCSFLVDGKGIIDKKTDYKHYRGNGQYAMNGWELNGDWITSRPQDVDDNPMLGENPSIPTRWLWDYPQSGEVLNLNSSGKIWRGQGARVLGVIKNRIFLGECIDENGETEQGKDRYCSISKGVVIHDLFYDEDWIQIGHLKRTAILEYREQGWFFNRQSLYRLMMPDIADASTWEFLDAEHGAGTFNSKTVALTPYGVAFCNENGIWLSDGRKPESITDNPDALLAVTGIYQKLAINKPYIYVDHIELGEVLIGEEGYNERMELLYDELKNELVLISPIAKIAYDLCEGNPEPSGGGLATHYTPETIQDPTHEIRLIYSFSNKNWRAEGIKLSKFSTYDPLGDATLLPQRTVTFATKGRMHFTRPGIFTMRVIPTLTDGKYSEFFYELATENYKALEDIYMGELTVPIKARIITHEIGNGIDDCNLDSLILECTARDSETVNLLLKDPQYLIDGYYDYYYSMLVDPKLFYQLRSDTFVGQTSSSTWQDIVSKNMATRATARNPFYTSSLQTPMTGGDESFGGSLTSTGRESLILLAPMQSKFRRARFALCSEVISKVNSIIMKYSIQKRKTYG